MRGLALGPASQKHSPFWGGNDGGGKDGLIQVQMSRVVGTSRDVGDEPTRVPHLPPHLVESSCASACSFLWGAFLDFLVARLLPYTQAGVPS